MHRHSLLTLSLILSSQLSFAAPSALFHVYASGNPTTLQFLLCLNGNAPLSCQQFTVNKVQLSITTTIPNHQYPYAGIKILTPGYVPTGCNMQGNGYCLFTASDTSVASIVVIPENAPWYPSLQAFEHYNSGRSHVFPLANFGGSLNGCNDVHAFSSAPDQYPSGYNMSYLNANYAFIYGGGYGNIAGSIGAYVSRIDPNTLQKLWNQQLIDVRGTEEWDYPGSVGILNDGYIYVSYGYRLAKLDALTGNIITTLVLPTGGGLPKNTSFNGFNATADGYIVMKSVYRQAGCLHQGPDALLNCPDPTDVPPSILISVNPTTMKVVDNITLPAPVGARPTIAQYNNKNYVYLLEATTAIRYLVQNGKFSLDTSWQPGTITVSGQTLSTSFVVVNDWVVAQTNTLPASTALTVIAINQGNAALQSYTQPFLGDPIPPLVLAAFSTAGPGGTQAISWAPMSVSGDPDTNIVYASDALPGEIAAIKLPSSSTLTPSVIWKANQTTTEFTTLINPIATRVLVGTDIPGSEIPGNNSNDYVVWRNALTGAELARSPLLPAMTQGTMVQPYYNGAMFYEGQLGSLVKLTLN